MMEKIKSIQILTEVSIHIDSDGKIYYISWDRNGNMIFRSNPD